jgi:rare lipoprotein A
MQTALVKHAPRAALRSYALRAALLGLGAALGLPASSALANTAGGASAKSAAVAPESQASGGSTTAGAPATPGATATAGATGGAAPVESQTRRRTLATWFGPGFYGDKTACGQTMSPALVGVASRTLPCGTLVRIGYRGHELTVPVVDRGPYGHVGAVWDLTAGTARALNIKETVRIATAIVGILPNSPTLGQPAEASPTEPAEASPTASAPGAAASTGGAAAS